jgi:hypothetical protein
MKKRSMLRRIAAFVVATAVMVLVGSAAHSYFVQHAWSIAAGHADGTGPVEIPFADRILWDAHDLVGMVLPYAGLAATALLLAFISAALVVRYCGHRVLVFTIAGAAAIFTLFFAMRMALGTVGIFGARGEMGRAAQMAAGALAGFVFARLTTPRSLVPG